MRDAVKLGVAVALLSISLVLGIGAMAIASPQVASTSTHSGSQGAPSQESTVSTYTISEGGTFYTVAIQPLNSSVSIQPGGRTTVFFQVSSPIGGTFYVGVGQNGSVDTPGFILDNIPVTLPTGVSASVLSGGVVTGTSSTLVAVVISVSPTSSASSLSLELFVFQHQIQGPGGYSVAQLPFIVEVA